MPEERGPHKPDSPKPGPQKPGRQSHDRLVVRKDAHRELEYRYYRVERLARGTAPRQERPSGAFFKNRTYRVVFLNVLLLAVLAFAGARLMQSLGDRGRVGPYAVTLQGLRYEGVVYATVTVRLAGRQSDAPPAERFTVRLALEPGGEQADQAAALPALPGQEVTVGEAIAFQEGPAKRVRAELEIGESRKRLVRDLAK
jgi:hypothetical protein